MSDFAMQNDDLIFAVLEESCAGTAIVCSPDRSIDVGQVENSWSMYVNGDTSMPVTCSNGPLETVTYAGEETISEPSEYELFIPHSSISDEDLIRVGGQNVIDLHISEVVKTPCFLTRGGSRQVHRFRVRVHMDVGCWADTADLLASNIYWTNYYQMQVYNGEEYLRERLDDCKREMELAKAMPLECDTVLPINVECGDGIAAGWIRLRELVQRDHCVDLCLFGGSVAVGTKLERIVSFSDSGSAQTIRRTVGTVVDFL